MWGKTIEGEIGGGRRVKVCILERGKPNANGVKKGQNGKCKIESVVAEGLWW